MNPIARANPPKLRVIIGLAAFVGLISWDRLVGVSIFLLLIVAELLLTPLLWLLSSILRWFRVQPAVAEWLLLLPFLSLCSYSVWRGNPYRREQDSLQVIFVDQVPTNLKVIDSKEMVGRDISTYEAWVECDPISLKQVLESSDYAPVDLSDPATRERYHAFPQSSPDTPPKENWLIFQRINWPPTAPNHHPRAWIITDSTFSWAFVNFVG